MLNLLVSSTIPNHCGVARPFLVNTNAVDLLYVDGLVCAVVEVEYLLRVTLTFQGNAGSLLSSSIATGRPRLSAPLGT